MVTKKLVLGLSGSPHRHGNTEQLLDRFLAGASDAGADSEKIILAGLDYSTCRGCNACHKTGICILSDDLNHLFTKILDEVDILGIASPIYSMNVTAELKGFIDRAQFIWSQKFITKTRSYSADHFRRHHAFFLSTAGMDDDTVFDATFPTIKAICNNLGFSYSGNILFHGMDIHGGIQGHPSALSEAFDAGKKAVLNLELL